MTSLSSLERSGKKWMKSEELCEWGENLEGWRVGFRVIGEIL